MNSISKFAGLVVAVPLLSTACVAGDDEPTSETFQAATSDAANGGTPGFYFLPPLVDPPTFSGTFDGSYKPRLKIDLVAVDCGGAGTTGATVFTWNTVNVYPASEQYKVAFNVGASINVSAGNCYRVTPLLDNAALGFRDVAVISGPAAAPPGYRKWGIGANQTINFRLENMDPDADGVLSHVDNCDFTANPGQEDGDGDGIGDACEPLCADLDPVIGQWTGDNTPNDSRGTAHGVWSGIAAYAAAVVGAGFAFDTTNYVITTFTYTGPWTVSLWAKANATQGKNTGLVSSSINAAADTFQIDWGVMGVYRFKAGFDALSVNFGAASTSTFQHLVVTYDGAGAVTTYLDGVQVGAGTWTGAPLRFTALRIGTNRGSTLRYNGTIDDVAVFSRALSASEVAALNTAAANGICP